jgi:hypothetical protein
MARDEQVGTNGSGSYYHLSPLSPLSPEDEHGDTSDMGDSSQGNGFTPVDISPGWLARSLAEDDGRK